MGLFNKFFTALSKTKNNFSEKLKILFARDKIGEDFYDDLEDILISSDVSVTTSEEIVENLRGRMIAEKAKDKDYVFNEIRSELLNCVNQAKPLLIKTPAVIMVIGVNGAGKTTSIGKLANYFVSEGKSVTVAAADTFRAAAAEQLGVWAERAKVRIVRSSEGCDPAAVVFDAVSSAKAKKTDVTIIDTAGRLQVKTNLMEELKKMDRVVLREYPEANYYKFIVLDATTGQNALSQVKTFNETAGIDGIILTKLDGTSKGGFIISLIGELCVPVVFVGTGEKIEDLSVFDPEAFIDGILGNNS